MRFGLDIAQQRVSFDEVVRRARLAEDLGFTGVWGFDHFQPMYGEGPGECFEGMTTLAALAGVTTEVRLGLLVTGVTYRQPSVFAAEALTVDHASHGRFDMGLGAAWAQREHDELGIEFPPLGRRFDLLEDTLEIVTRLFTGERVSYAGHQVSLDNAQLRPLPVQTPHPPIWIGGKGPKRTLPLIARFADYWHVAGAGGDTGLADRLASLCAEIGRDPHAIRRADSLSLSEPWPDVRANVEQAINRGFDYLICGWPGEGSDRVREFAETTMANYAN